MPQNTMCPCDHHATRHGRGIGCLDCGCARDEAAFLPALVLPGPRRSADELTALRLR